MNLANVGGSMTGGATVVLTPAGLYAGGKASFTTPDHTRLTPEVIDFLVTPAQTTKDSPGVARSGLKIALASRVETEGCCDVQAGTVIIDVGLRWPLSQPESAVDDAIDLLQALVFNAAFTDALKKGILPIS
jgi:hypothetical protein